MKIVKIDEEFICENCGKEVKKLGYTSRDHCPHCLHSKHLDINPGDRMCDCNGILKPVSIDYNTKKGYMIIYKCEKCGEVRKNKTAKDDNQEQIMNIMRLEM